MKIHWTALHAQVHQVLLDRQILPLQSKILIAVSGGQDSLCLAQLLLDLQPRWDWHLEVVYCDHGWRSDSKQNADHVENLAQLWGLIYHRVVAHTDVSTEAKARDWRYSTFETLAQTHAFTHVALGHTASDRAETLLYNLARGSGAEGLQSLGWSRASFSTSSVSSSAASSAVSATSTSTSSANSSADTHLAINPAHLSPQIVRPLLAITRSQTATFCRDRQLPIWHDTTNDDLTYRRNCIRQQILPLIQEVLNPQADRHFAQTAELLGAEIDFLQEQARLLFEQVVVRSNDGVPHHAKLQRHTLAAAPLALQRRVLRLFCQSTLNLEANFEQIENLLCLLKAANRSQSSPLKGGTIGLVEGEWIVWRSELIDQPHQSR